MYGRVLVTLTQCLALDDKTSDLWLFMSCRKNNGAQSSPFVGAFGSQEAVTAFKRLKQSLNQEKKRRA